MIEITIDDMRKYFPSIVMRSQDISIFEAAIDEARRAIIRNVISTEVENALSGDILAIAKRTIAIKAFLSSMAELDVTLTDAGFAVVDTEGLLPASKVRVDNLRSSLEKRLLDCVMELISSLRMHGDWNKSNLADLYCGGLLATRDELIMATSSENIPCTWEKYQSLYGLFIEVLHFLIMPALGEEFVSGLIMRYQSNDLSVADRHILPKIQRTIAAHAFGKDSSTLLSAILSYMAAHPDDYPGYISDITPSSKDLKIQDFS